MNSPKKLITISAMAFAMFLPACSESGMKAKNQEKAEVPAGTQMYVRINQNLPSSDKGWKSGDEFQGTLARPLEVAGRVIAPEGTVVKGDLTNKIDTDNTGTTAPDRGATGTYGTPGATGTPSATDNDKNRMGLELKKIVLNGDEYKIDTLAVPIPEGMSGMSGMSGMNEGSAANDKTHNRHMGNQRNAPYNNPDNKMSKSDKEAMAKSDIAGHEFVFTLKDKADLPATTNNMKTE